MNGAVFLIHIEPATDRPGVVWWAETPRVHGLSIAADSLRELRTLIDDAAARHLPAGTDVELTLDVYDPEPAPWADVRLENEALDNQGRKSPYVLVAA